MRHTIIAASALVALGLLAHTGCGLDDLGVRSINFSMAPTSVPEPPADLDGLALAQISTSSATVSVDVLEDSGMLMTDGLPALADTLDYVVMLMFADDDRAELPGTEETGHTGHTHGPLSTAPLDPAQLPRLADEPNPELTAVVLGPLMATADAGVWMAMFGSEDVPGQSLGALRAAMIMVVPDTGAAAMVLFGQVEAGHDESSGETSGGHSHGP